MDTVILVEISTIYIYYEKISDMYKYRESKCSSLNINENFAAL